MALALAVSGTVCNAVEFVPNHSQAAAVADVIPNNTLQAFWRALNSVFGDKIQFKTTLKGASMLMNSAFRDLWVPGLCFFLLFATMIAGLIQLFTGLSLLLMHSIFITFHSCLP